MNNWKAIVVSILILLIFKYYTSLLYFIFNKEFTFYIALIKKRLGLHPLNPNYDITSHIFFYSFQQQKNAWVNSYPQVSNALLLRLKFLQPLIPPESNGKQREKLGDGGGCSFPCSIPQQSHHFSLCVSHTLLGKPKGLHSISHNRDRGKTGEEGKTRGRRREKKKTEVEGSHCFSRNSKCPAFWVFLISLSSELLCSGLEGVDVGEILPYIRHRPFSSSSSSSWSKMGCISSKSVVAKAYSPSPTRVEVSETNRSSSRGRSGLKILDSKANLDNERNNKFKKNSSKKSNGAFNLRVGLAQRSVEAEQNAVGWPPWLTAVAAEAIQGWVPLKADSFQKLEKVITEILFMFFLLCFIP